MIDWHTPRAFRSSMVNRLAILAATALLAACGRAGAPEAAAAAKPALSVQAIAPQTVDWPRTLSANGDVVAWQEAVIGAELSGLRIVEVAVEVGQTVRKGQVLARLDAATAASEQAEARAAVAELEASVAEARGNAARAKELQAKGFYSQQMNTQYQTAEQATAARLAAARARLDAAALRLARTEIKAPDDGVVSARSAAVGSLATAGQELFRLIRGGRLEWRAAVPSADLGRIVGGGPVRITAPGGETVDGKVRQVAPAVDPATRNGTVFVDLPAGGVLRAGMFARGEFELGRAPAFVVPQAAVVLREGFAYVFTLQGADRVAQTKVGLGRRQGELVEIVDGLPAAARIVASGAGFLADGDLVQVLAAGVGQ